MKIKKYLFIGIVLMFLSLNVFGLDNLVRNSDFDSGSVAEWDTQILNGGFWLVSSVEYHSPFYSALEDLTCWNGIGNDWIYAHPNLYNISDSGAGVYYLNSTSQFRLMNINFWYYVTFNPLNSHQNVEWLMHYKSYDNLSTLLRQEVIYLNLSLGSWNYVSIDMTPLEVNRTHTFYFTIRGECPTYSGYLYSDKLYLDDVELNFASEGCNTSLDCLSDEYCDKATKYCFNKITGGNSCGISTECNLSSNCDNSCLSDNCIYGTCSVCNESLCPDIENVLNEYMQYIPFKDYDTGKITHYFREWHEYGVEYNYSKKLNWTVYNDDSATYLYYFANSNEWRFPTAREILVGYDPTRSIIDKEIYKQIKFEQFNYLNESSYEGHYIIYNDSCVYYDGFLAYNFYECQSWFGLGKKWCYKYNNILYTGIYWNTTDIDNFTGSYPIVNNTDITKYLSKLLL